jgi:hypothetical protein
MPHHTATVLTVVRDDDRLFLEQVARMCRTRVDFLLSQRRAHGSDLYASAGEVLIYLEGRFITVQEIYETCAAHGWNSLVYEACAYETANRVRAQMAALDPIASQALRAYASDVLDTEPHDAWEAIREAHDALYGAGGSDSMGDLGRVPVCKEPDGT